MALRYLALGGVAPSFKMAPAYQKLYKRNCSYPIMKGEHRCFRFMGCIGRTVGNRFRDLTPERSYPEGEVLRGLRYGKLTGRTTNGTFFGGSPVEDGFVVPVYKQQRTRTVDVIETLSTRGEANSSGTKKDDRQ